MPQADLQGVAATQPFARLPVTFEQACSRSSALLMLLLLVSALATLLVPLALLAVSATPAIGAAVENPLATLQVLLGLTLMSTLFLLPAKRLIERWGGARRVHIDGEAVSVSMGALGRAFAGANWRLPLAEFSGITRRLRSTLSGVGQELYLVHADPRKCLVIFAADEIPQATVERAAALLGLPEIPMGGNGGARGLPKDPPRWPPPDPPGSPRLPPAPLASP
jgi:hypothetical protein